MKNRYIFSLLLLLIITCSCDDILDKAPNYKPTAEGYFVSEAAAQEARIGMYSTNASHAYFKDYIFMWDGMTDQLYDQYNWGQELSVARGAFDASIGGVVSGFYNDAYRVIATINDLIAHVEGMDESLFVILPQEQYIAEARFFKAYYYFYLTELYGGVPLYKTALTSVDESKVEQTPKSEIIDYILNELELAINNLPNGPYDGYVKKGAAQTLKAKILLHNQQWQKAADVAQEVISSGTYGLHSDYAEIFIKKGQVGNREIIFASDFQFPDFSHSLSRYLVHSAAAVPRVEFVNSYLMQDGLTVAESPLESSDYQNRDPRLYMTVRLPDDIWYYDNGSEVAFEPTLSGFYTKKFLDEDINDNNSLHQGGTSEQSIVHLRYADLLLMYAEAKYQLGKLDQGVVDETINLIRERSGMATVTDITSFSDSEKFDLIKYERSIELAFERYRYFDLKRWGILGETLVSLTDPNGLAMNWEDHFSLWPFSISELTLNPNLVQNPGY